MRNTIIINLVVRGSRTTALRMLCLQIPSGSPIHLNTSSFKLIIPKVRTYISHASKITSIVALFLQLYKAYPNMAMVLYLHAPKPPNMVVSASSINVTVPAYVNVSVIDSSTKLTKPAFTLSVVSHEGFVQRSA